MEPIGSAAALFCSGSEPPAALRKENAIEREMNEVKGRAFARLFRRL
jgi:hypothetical protein